MDFSFDMITLKKLWIIYNYKFEKIEDFSSVQRNKSINAPVLSSNISLSGVEDHQPNDN